MSRFKIGQRVVALVNHSLGRFKKGDEFIVDGFACCDKCGGGRIYLKGFNLTVNARCTRCPDMAIAVRQQYNESSFAPISSIADAIEYKLSISIPELTEINQTQLQ